MAAAANEVSTNLVVDTKRSRGLARRRNWSEAFKRQIVAETLEPGSSVSMVARRHDVNANQLFKWRRELLLEESSEAVEDGRIVPVEIVTEPERRQPRRRAGRAGFIEIEFGSGTRVHVHGEAAPKTLRQVIELLR
jgi:transposase